MKCQNPFSEKNKKTISICRQLFFFTKSAIGFKLCIFRVEKHRMLLNTIQLPFMDQILVPFTNPIKLVRTIFYISIPHQYSNIKWILLKVFYILPSFCSALSMILWSCYIFLYTQFKR